MCYATQIYANVITTFMKGGFTINSNANNDSGMLYGDHFT